MTGKPENESRPDPRFPPDHVIAEMVLKLLRDGNGKVLPSEAIASVAKDLGRSRDFVLGVFADAMVDSAIERERRQA